MEEKQQVIINYDLPTLDIAAIKNIHDLSVWEESVLLDMLYKPVDGRGIIRATRPKESGLASWAWRHMMTFVSSEEKFHAVSCNYDKYLADEPSPTETQYKLMMLVEKALDTVPNEQLHGLNAWNNVMCSK